MICLSQPRYPSEIQELLESIGRKTKQSQLLIDNPNSTITKLINKGWLKEISEKEKNKIIEKIDDGRAKKRRYIQSTLEPLVNYFKIQIELAKNEQRQLKHLFEKKSVKQLLSFENGFHYFNQVKTFLVNYTIWEYISIKYTDPYRLSIEKVKKIGEKKILSEILEQIYDKRNEIAKRILPDLKVEPSPEKQQQFYVFSQDIMDKLKPPLSNKLMKLYNKNQNFFEMAISLLACGEFINEFKQKIN